MNRSSVILYLTLVVASAAGASVTVVLSGPLLQHFLVTPINVQPSKGSGAILIEPERREPALPARPDYAMPPFTRVTPNPRPLPSTALSDAPPQPEPMEALAPPTSTTDPTTITKSEHSLELLSVQPPVSVEPGKQAPAPSPKPTPRRVGKRMPTPIPRPDEPLGDASCELFQKALPIFPPRWRLAIKAFQSAE